MVMMVNANLIEEQIVLTVFLHTRFKFVLLYSIIKFYLTYHVPTIGKHKSNSHISKAICHHGNMSQDMRYPTMLYVRPAKAQTSLLIRAVWWEPLLVAWIFVTVKLLSQQPLEFLSLKKAAPAHRSLRLIKCHNVGNHMIRLIFKSCHRDMLHLSKCRT